MNCMLCNKKIEGKAEKYTCATCHAALPAHAQCTSGALDCRNPKKQAHHKFTVASAPSSGSSALLPSVSSSSGGQVQPLLAIASSGGHRLPEFSCKNPFAAFKFALTRQGSQQGFCHGCMGRSDAETLNTLVAQKQRPKAFDLYSKILLKRALSLRNSVQETTQALRGLRESDDGFKPLERRLEKQTESLHSLGKDAGWLGMLAHDSPSEQSDAWDAGYKQYQENDRNASPDQKVVARLFSFIERKSAHCVISNQYLEYYSPQIIASFHQILNADDYVLAWHAKDDPDNPYWRSIEKVLDTILSPDKFGRGDPGARYTLLMGELAEQLETLQDIPMLVGWFLGMTRFSLAMMARRFGAPSKLATPVPDERPPPEQGGRDPLKVDLKLGATSQACVLLVNIVGNCRLSAFEVGRQCESCEVDQGEDPLIRRYLMNRELTGASLEALVRDYRGRGGVWGLVVDFLREGLDEMGKKYLKGLQLLAQRPWCEGLVHEKNWLFFNLYYATCMLEASYGLSPFRDSKWPEMNPFTVEPA